jgi:hypothetical protein
VAGLVAEILADEKRVIDVLVAAVLAEDSLSKGESAECVRERLRLAII